MEVRLSERIAPAFYPVHRAIKEHQYTHYVLRGGRGSTKSSFASLETVLLLKKYPLLSAVVFRKVATTLRDSVVAQYMWAVEALGLENEFEAHVSPMELVLKGTGQKILFRGADDKSKIKSVKVGRGYLGVTHFEELDQFDSMEEIRSILQSTMRGGDSFWNFMTYNPPKSRDSWVNREMNLKRQDRLVHTSSYLDVPPAWLGEAFIREAEYLKQVNFRAYEHEYLGIVTGTGGNVFDNVKLRSIGEEEIARFDREYLGIDWGWYPDPMRFVKVSYLPAERRLYLYDEFGGNRLSNAQISEKLREHGVGFADRITADSGGEGMKSVADFRDMGFSMRPAKKGPGSVEYSMKWLSSLAEIVIDPVRCPLAAREFTEYEFDRNRSGEVVGGYPDRNNHSIDAVRYALERVWRKKGA